MMRKKDRLCALQMRVSRQNCLPVFSRKLHQGALEGCDSAANFVGLVSKIKPQIEGDLIVSAPSSVQFRASRTDP